MTDSQYNSVNEIRIQEFHAWLHLVAPAFDKLQAVATDAGMRKYFRLFTQDSTLIAVDADPAYEDSEAFIDIATRLANSGLSTPRIHHYNLEKGFLLLEDLGHHHLLEWLTETPACTDRMYRMAVDSLITMQQSTITTGLPRFDRQFILQELNIFDEWYVGRHLQISPDAQHKRIITSLKETLIHNCEQQPQAFMHRDFHSRNLMVPVANALSIIDFQGAMYGPVTYDIGSLLKDAYVSTPEALERELCEYHRLSLANNIAPGLYKRWYDLTALQRHIKIMGIFCRLYYRDNKSNYLPHLHTVATYIRRTLEQYRELEEFCDLFNHLTRVKPA